MEKTKTQIVEVICKVEFVLSETWNLSVPTPLSLPFGKAYFKTAVGTPDQISLLPPEWRAVSPLTPCKVIHSPERAVNKNALTVPAESRYSEDDQNPNKIKSNQTKTRAGLIFSKVITAKGRTLLLG